MITPESFNSFQSQRGAFAFAFASTFNALKDHLNYCRTEQFTGQVEVIVQFTQAKPWNFYFEQGNLVWGDGGVHPLRRWHRQLCRWCPAQAAALMQETMDQAGNYEFLTTLLLQKLQAEDVGEIITGLLAEILFDIQQQWSRHQYSSTLQLKFSYVQLNAQITSIAVSPDDIWMQTLQEWQEWRHAGLENYLPNHAPAIRNAEMLRQQVLPGTYQNLVAAMDGTQTLRDIAAKSNKNLLMVAKSLLPYLQQSLVKLVEIEDLRPASVAVPLSPLSFSKPLVESKPEAPLIAYIDDYKVDGQLMGRILAQLGYRFIHIQDPMQALPLLLEHKPDLIFLDLVMPIINGYEACAQIRRVSRFRETPIIILTSNDGILDRVRAKIVGSTGFLAKPIESTKVQAILQKYLPQFFKNRHPKRSGLAAQEGRIAWGDEAMKQPGLGS